MSDMFYKYPDIENSYQEELIEKIKRAGYGCIQYIIMEKIHGSNTQIDYNYITGEFAFGKRSGLLEESETFYNLQSMLTEELKSSMRCLAEMMQCDLIEYGLSLSTVKFYGEIFGGSYPHEDVPKDKDAIKVQKAVFYSPSNHWMAFDVAFTVYGTDKVFFLSGSKFWTLCILAGIPTVPILTVADTLVQALAYPNDGLSKVYEKYGLPPIEDNVMEGVVIRPYNKDVWLGNTRVILKNKNQKFSEKKNAKKELPSEDVPARVLQAREEISQFITYNRVHNVISHIGEVTPKDIGKVIQLTTADTLKDYNKEFHTLCFLDKKEEKMVTKFLAQEVGKIVRDVVIFGKDS